MIRKVAIIGAAGMLGKPVVDHMIASGLEVTCLVRNPLKAENLLSAGARIVHGDVKDAAAVDELLSGQDAVYISLSVPQNEKKNDWHSETDGLKIILASAAKNGVKRILLLSSLIQRYQGMNNFKWWVFDLKLQSVKMVKESGIAYTIFYPSTFMESFIGKYKQGKRILMAGSSEHSMFYIAGPDYARQLVRSLPITINKEYVIQGPDPLRPEDAAKIFVQHYKPERLSISHAPFGLLKFLGNFSSTINYGSHIIEALNRYPEKFESENAWEELGRPQITLREFAESL